MNKLNTLNKLLHYLLIPLSCPYPDPSGFYIGRQVAELIVPLVHRAKILVIS